MTYPAESVQIGYQNHVEDVRSFLDSRHADHYTVFNLSQRNYRGAKFSNRVSAFSPLKPQMEPLLDDGFVPRKEWKTEEWLQMWIKHLTTDDRYFSFILPSSPYEDESTHVQHCRVRALFI